jgi:hypothetical protein
MAAMEEEEYDPVKYINAVIHLELMQYYDNRNDILYTVTHTPRYAFEYRLREGVVQSQVHKDMVAVIQQIVDDLNAELDKEEAEDQLHHAEMIASTIDKEPLSETYDVVVLLNLHGVYDLEDPDVSVPTCIERTIPEGKYVTFLQGTPCGVTNFVTPNFFDYTRSYFDTMVDLYKKCDREIAVNVQNLLRSIKTTFIKNPPSVVKKGLQSESEMVKHEVRAYLRTPGWDLITSGVTHRTYVDKRYGVDPGWRMSAVVIYSKHDTLPVNTQLVPLVHNPHERGGPLTREGLLNYCFLQGARHVLFIDPACGGINTQNVRDARMASKKVRDSGKGGKRTRKYKRKTRNRKHHV